VRVCVLDGPTAAASFPFQYLEPAGRWLGAAGRVGGACPIISGVVAAPAARLSAIA